MLPETIGRDIVSGKTHGAIAKFRYSIPIFYKTIVVAIGIKLIHAIRLTSGKRKF